MLKSKKWQPFRRAGIMIIVCALCSGTLFSCGLGIRIRALLGGKLYINVDVSKDVNENNPVGVDVVFVYDEKLLQRMLEFPAKEWFEKKEQIKRDYVEGIGLDCWSWEWVPNQQVPVQKLPLEARAKGGLIYANYQTPGPHRVRFDPFRDISVRLEKEDFVIEPF